MSRIEYDLLRRDRPDLSLWDWLALLPRDRAMFLKMSRDQVITFYAAVKLSGSFAVAEDFRWSPE